MLIKLQNDIENTMKRGEMTLDIFTYYSEAFDTFGFGILLLKMLKTTDFYIGQLVIYIIKDILYKLIWTHLALDPYYLICVASQ